MKSSTSVDWMARGYCLSGLANGLGILLFSQVFTNSLLGDLYPEVFSKFGLGMIVLWGLAYIAVAQRWRELRALAFVFAVEKFAYFISWVVWISAHGGELSGVFDRSPLTGIFFAIYGVNDLLFMGMFLVAGLRASRK